METKKILVLMVGVSLLAGCISKPEIANSKIIGTTRKVKPYPDVKVSRVLRVIDGDTFACDIDEHCAIAGKNISIRLRDINTPELRAKDPELRESAILEKQRLTNLLKNARSIELRNIGRGKYFRVVADVYIDGESLLPKLNQQYLRPQK